MRKTSTPTYPAYHEPWLLEPHYSHHVGAMTAERLHDKADIAFQLALRDKRLADIKAQLAIIQASGHCGTDIMSLDRIEKWARELGWKDAT